MNSHTKGVNSAMGMVVVGGSNLGTSKTNFPNQSQNQPKKKFRKSGKKIPLGSTSPMMSKSSPNTTQGKSSGSLGRQQNPKIGLTKIL